MPFWPYSPPSRPVSIWCHWIAVNVIPMSTLCTSTSNVQTHVHVYHDSMTSYTMYASVSLLRSILYILPANTLFSPVVGTVSIALLIICCRVIQTMCWRHLFVLTAPKGSGCGGGWRCCGQWRDSAGATAARRLGKYLANHVLLLVEITLYARTYRIMRLMNM